MFNKELFLLLICLSCSTSIFSLYKGTFKSIQQPRILPSAIKYQKLPPTKSNQFGKTVPRKTTPLFRNQSYIDRDQRRFFYEMTGDMAPNLPFSNMQTFMTVHQEVSPNSDFIIPLIRLLPKNQNEQGIFIEKLLKESIQKIDTKKYLSPDFTLPIYLVQILASYAANTKNINALPAMINFSEASQRISLVDHSLHRELENKIENFILRANRIKFPLAKGLWASFNRKSLIDLTYSHDYLDEGLSILLMFVFEKELQIANEIIAERKNYGNYDQKTMIGIEMMLACVQEKFQQLFDRSKINGIYLKNYRETIRSSLWDIVEEYIKKHYFDNKLSRIQKNMPDGTDPEYENEL